MPQIGHASDVTAAAFSPDGRTALSGSGDKTLKLWDVATGQELRTFTGHTGSVNLGRLLPGWPHRPFRQR